VILSKRVTAVAGAALILVFTAGCTSAPQPTPAHPAVTQVNMRTYTKADLETILGTVNTKLKLDGGIATTDGPKPPSVNAVAGAIGDSATTTPASCTRFTQFDAQVIDLLGTTGVIIGTVAGPHLNLIVATVSGHALPASLPSSFAARERAILTTCKRMAIVAPVDGKTISATIDDKSLQVKTDANQSFGYQEHVVITSGGGGSTTTSTWLDAIDGNLLLFTTSVTVPDQAGLEKAVNAVVAAAKG
jgi:hypothetical protein